MKILLCICALGIFQWRLNNLKISALYPYLFFWGWILQCPLKSYAECCTDLNGRVLLFFLLSSCEEKDEMCLQGNAVVLRSQWPLPWTSEKGGAQAGSKIWLQIEKGPAAFGRSIVREKGPNDNSAHAESQGPSCQSNCKAFFWTWLFPGGETF